MVYYVQELGGPIATAGVGEVFAQLWNPSSTRRIKVVEVALFYRDFDLAGFTFFIVRSSARGTAGSTSTPDADNSDQGDSAPPSGALLDLCEFTVQPTLATPEISCPGVMHTSAGSGFIAPFPRGIVVPPGTGLCICERTLSTFSGGPEVTFVFED